MADIYYKSGNSWKVLASNPYGVGTYVLTRDDISPATIVGGTWEPASPFGSINNVSDGLVTQYDFSISGSKVTGYIIFSGLAWNPSVSSKSLLTGLPPARGGQALIATPNTVNLNYNNSIWQSTNLYITTSGELYIPQIYSLGNPTTVTYPGNQVQIEYECTLNVPSIDGVNYIWLKVA